MDLAPYFRRIGYDGAREPTLATLHALTYAHSSSIPFENLDVLLGRRIGLDEQALFAKLVHGRRGGYCFEQNGLFLRVLETLGFRVAPLSARVQLDRPRDYLPARTHLFVRVELGGETYFTDVGVGSMSLTSALRFEFDREQVTPHEPRRIVREAGRYFHQVKLGAVWNDVCEFTLEEMPPIDREVANWYTSTHPDSGFRGRLIASRAAPEGRRITLLNDELKTRDASGHAAVTKISDPDALLHALHTNFGLAFDAGTRFGTPGEQKPWPM
jgi:N-hydroxyarylamine O-acetyltransferase